MRIVLLTWNRFPVVLRRTSQTLQQLPTNAAEFTFTHSIPQFGWFGTLGSRQACNSGRNASGEDVGRSTQAGMALLAREILWVGRCMHNRYGNEEGLSRRRVGAGVVVLARRSGGEGGQSFGRTWRIDNNNKKRRNRLGVRAAAQESLYETLGVSSTATEKEIKRAYRGLALKFHPDVNKQPDAQEKFLRIKNAYQTLVDSKSRSKYDASSRSRSGDWDPFNWDPSPGSARKSSQQQEEFYGFNEFFRDLQSDLQKRSSARSEKPKSLWEELADIGEEFVEFLEKELNLSELDEMASSKTGGNKNDTKQRGSKTSSRSNTSGTNTSKKAAGPVDERATVENEIAEIEDMLAKLKKDMGM